MRLAFIAAAAFLALPATLPAAAQSSANPVITDPMPDKANPPRLEDFRIMSHGSGMNAIMYVAGGAGSHPAVVLFHGFPGNEQNLDLAQAIRRAGFNVLTLHYRGSWGSPGKFNFANAIEDADAAVAFLRDPANVAKFHTDPTRIFAAGHSMGGFMAASAALHDPKVAGLIMISAWNIGAEGPSFANPAYRARRKAEMDDDVVPLGGVTSDQLMDEALANKDKWDFANWADGLKSRPVMLLSANDGTQKNAETLAANLKKAGDTQVDISHWDNDHSYSDHRIAMETAVTKWLMAHAAMH